MKKALTAAVRPFVAAACLALFGAGAATAQDIHERTIRFGHLNNADHPVSFGVKRFGELLAAKSGGKLKVQEFPASQLGNEMQQQSALQGGVQEMSAPATTSLAGIVKEFGLIDFPFAVTSFAQADALLDGPFGQALLARLPEKGLVALGYWDLGFRNLTNSKRPVTRPEDFDGLKVRVIPNPVFLETFKAFKANPVPMPFAELYGALESKAVDGQENPFAVILSNKFFEVQKYVSATNHVYAANIVLVSKKFWDKLTPTEQKLMHEAADEARGYQRQVSRAAAQKAVADLQAKGMQYNEVAPAEQARMRAISKPVTDRFAATYDPAIFRLYSSELARVTK
ncbi:DctP family TRAP transporter solute-binding subunit [Xylophilus rhododendri]|uniref:DctP family TRAP transporter solute-binding subunit n=1 Tax=Xylophilus rhododendri TaxID=2697032 RepID=A0A857JA71_9BURK|nr:TRAP transporter substrate-binding protein [Xylophilus rhododendri]QHJ00628.1 DctP family TRAP transporter solute-binding subunit [Xylophilus rhododendri]